MNKTSIEFCDFTWNPITGCQNGCDYCWAKKFNDRYMKQDFYKPEFHEERLLQKIPNIPKIRNYIAQIISPDKPLIFVVDMGDIFSPGVEWEWKDKVFDYIKIHPEANFLLLTKRPNEYLPLKGWIPKGNTFIGTSLDYAHNWKRIVSIKQMGLMGFRTFINIEPLMSRMDMVDFNGIDFIVIGALTGRKYRPDGWHKSINHPKIYYKNNYLQYFPELQTI